MLIVNVVRIGSVVTIKKIKNQLCIDPIAQTLVLPVVVVVVEVTVAVGAVLVEVTILVVSVVVPAVTVAVDTIVLGQGQADNENFGEQ